MENKNVSASDVKASEAALGSSDWSANITVKSDVSDEGSKICSWPKRHFDLENTLNPLFGLEYKPNAKFLPGNRSSPQCYKVTILVILDQLEKWAWYPPLWMQWQKATFTSLKIRVGWLQVSHYRISLLKARLTVPSRNWSIVLQMAFTKCA